MNRTRETWLSVFHEMQSAIAEIDCQIGQPKTPAKTRRELRKLEFLILELENNWEKISEILFRKNLHDIEMTAKSLNIDLNFKSTVESSEAKELAVLSKREREVLHLLPRGDSIKELANYLHLSEATIKSHLTSIYRKLGVSNRVQAISKSKGLHR